MTAELGALDRHRVWSATRAPAMPEPASAALDDQGAVVSLSIVSVVTSVQVAAMLAWPGRSLV